MFEGLRYLVIGSGFSGAVLAERIASGLGENVLVLEKRDHVGGNSWSSAEAETNIECHWYGSHIFHTRHDDVWDYVRRFGKFTGYRHRVMTEHAGRVFSMPISLDTINAFYGKNLKPCHVEAFIREEAESAHIMTPRNLEEKAITLIGRPLYEALIKGYTRKQWNRDPRELPAQIITRLPVRTDYNTCYFGDPYQGIPVDGYGRLITRLLTHERITVRTGVDFDSELRREAEARPELTLIYTGRIDRYFDCCYGELEWRSLRFEFETVNVRDYQGISVMNYADADVPYTRIHEFKHYHPERAEIFDSGKSVICREYPLDHAAGREPYYPVNSAANQALYARYREQADRLPGTIFCGRLGTYAYCDMDVAIKQALDVFAQHFAPLA